MSKPLISIIIPCYNQAHYLSCAIESCLAQTYTHIEIIVVDDGSPDNTPDVVACYGDKIRYIRQENAGLSAARNTGILAATGEFIHLLDSDDFLQPQIFEKVVEASIHNPAVSVFYCDCFFVDSKGMKMPLPKNTITTDAEHVWRSIDVSNDPFHGMLQCNIAPPVCFTVRRKDIIKTGLFDTQLRSCEDWDMWLRLAAAGYSFRHIDGLYANYRTYPNSMSRNSERMLQAGMRVLKKASAYHKNCALCRTGIKSGQDDHRNKYLFVPIEIEIGYTVKNRSKSRAFLQALRFIRKHPVSIYYFVGKALGQR